MTRFASMLAVLIAISLLLLAGVPPARATQCNVTATPVGFGSYDPLATAPFDSTGSISVTCNTPPRLTQTVSILLTAGNSGNFAQRSMTSTSGAPLLYNLFANASMTEVFGDGSGGSTTLTRIVDRDTPWTATIYGRIPARQNVSAGTYSDTIVVTILW